MSARIPHRRPLVGVEPLEPRTLLTAVVPLDQTFTLHSRPGASKVIYLDFNGHFTPATAGWNGGQAFNTPAYSIDGNPAFNNTELTNIQDIWQRVAEDFIPFEVDVTTEEPPPGRLNRDNASDTFYGIRVVIGGDGEWLDGGLSAGVAFIGTFASFNAAPAFVFSEGMSVASIADTASHEVGHTLGLSHDGGPGTQYYRGHGSGPTGWAPIMGSGNRQLTQWSNGNYPGATNLQNDLQIIVSNNGFGYRPDDHGNTIATATPLTLDGTNLSASGIIGRNTDVDVFTFATVGGPVSININPAPEGPNLDVLAILYDGNGVEIARSNPSGSLSASFDLTLPPGKYYLAVDGGGESSPAPGYNDYGSLGQYTITGSATGVYLADVDDQMARANKVAAPRVNRTVTIPGDILSPDGNLADVDLFRIKVVKNARFRFDLDAAETGSGLDTHLRLFNRWGQEIAANDDGATPGEPATTDSTIHIVFPTGGVYYLGVSSSGNTSYDPWTGEGDAPAASAGPYTLHITRLPPVRDPDDQRREATLITDSHLGAIQTLEDGTSDVDVVKFFAEKGSTIRIELDTSGGSLDGYLRLFRAGREIAAGENVIEFTFAKRGMYFIGISAAGNTAYNVNNGRRDAPPGSEGEYRLTLTAVAPAIIPATDWEPRRKPLWSLLPIE